MEHQGILLPHGTNTMRFIYLQLVELTRECDCTIQSGMVSTNDFLELETRLEKLLYESHSAYNPPIRKPRMSDFKEIKNLASSDFGSVEHVRHKKTGQSFAMKVVYWASVTTPAQVQQLFVVRDILTFAENPFIISMACSFETDKYLGFVVDYVEGPNCESQLGVLKRFPVDMARLYVAEAIIAVHYLHNLGIVHRDLKPANMLISATGHIKLTDFGISKIGPVNMTTERHQGSILDIVKEFTDREITGSPVYIAPEMLLQDGYGKPVDWWALGIILYKFLLGVVPFNGCRLRELFTQVLKYELTWPEGRHNLTNDAKDLIISLLKKNPAQRLGTRGAYELGEHRFFQNLDMDNLLSEVPLYIPKLESGDTCSEIDRESEDEEDSAVVEYLDEDEDDENSFTYVAFRFRKAYDKPRPLPSSSKLNLNEGNFQECVESFDDKEVIPDDEGKVEEATGSLDEEYVVSDEDYIEEAAEILDEEKVMVGDEGNDKEVDEILPHATNTVVFIYLQLLELALECHTTIRSGTVSTNNLLVVENKLEKLQYETLSAVSPPVRKPKISDFKEIQHLASGNSGSVELVRHKKTGQLFAMKVIDRKSLTKPKKIQRLFVERDILTFAENPFITSMACSFEMDMYLGFVMDYVEGPNCESQLDVLKRFPVDMARLYVAETVTALNYLHSIGILHGDVKPANMLISATGHIKLTDFGISKIGPVNMTTVRHQGSILDIVREFTDKEIPGSPVYIAPEVILADGYGKPIDWWALGIILYEFLLGDVPFDEVDMDKMFLQVLTYELTWPEGRHDLTHDAKDLITSLLKKNPVERLGTRRVHEVKDHPFFRSLNMDNLLSEVPLYIPELECVDTRSAQDQSDTCGKGMESDNDSTSKDGEDSPVDEYLDEDDNDEDEDGYLSFTYVAFRFRKAYEEKEVLPYNERYVEEADEVLPHATNTLRFIYLQLLHLARECDSTIQSGVVSTNDFLELAGKLKKLHYETYSAYSPPVRKPQMSDFEELQHLASGNCGSVELVRHKKTGQSYAMKLVNRRSVTTSIQVQQLFVERDILTFAENPFITSMACSFETDMYLGFVMDYVEGLDCDYALDVVKRFPFHMARLYVAETVMALKYLHSLGIVHRDLKPANMLISTAGHMKLTDFGISKIGPVNMTMERNEGSMLDIVKEFTDREIVGSLVYIAPEVFLQDGYGKPLDWWALGIILYEFLLGDVPFDGRDLKEQHNQMQIKNLTWPEETHDLTHDAKDLIAALLKKNPVERLGTRGAHEVRDHPFFQNLDMNNLLSEVPLYIPEFDYGDTCSENESESNEGEDSIDDENLDENEENYISFTYVAFRFRQANEEEEVMTSSEKSVKEAAEHLDDEEDKACNEENLEETAESLDDEVNTGHNDGKVEDAAEIPDDEEFMTAGEDNVEEAADILDDEEDITFDEDNVEEAADILDDEEDITFDEGNVEEAPEILYHEEDITCREEHIKEATEILDEEESMTSSEKNVEEAAVGIDEEKFMISSEDNVEEAAEILDEEESMTSSEDNVEEAAEILHHEEDITCREEHIKEAAKILDEEEFKISSEYNVEEAAESLDEEEFMTSSEDNVEEAAESLDEEELMTSREEHVKKAAKILDEEEFKIPSEENVEEAAETLDEEESMTSSEDNVEEAAEILHHEEDMAYREEHIKEAAKILDEEEFKISSEENVEEAAESLDEEEFMTSSEDNVEEAAESLDEEESMTFREEHIKEAAKILDEEEFKISSEEHVKKAVIILDEEESMISSEDNVEEAAESLDEEESMTSREEHIKEAAKILDEEEFKISSEDHVKKAAKTIDEEESMTFSEDNVEEAAEILHHEEDITCREEHIKEAAKILDEEESMTSSEENVEEAAESLDEEEFMTSREEHVKKAAIILDEVEFKISSEEHVKKAAKILDEEEFKISSEDNVEEAPKTIDEEESMTSSEDNVEEAAESLDEEEFKISSEENVEEAAESLDEEEFMTSREEHVKKAAIILDEVEFMTSREEHVKKAVIILDEVEFITSRKEHVKKAAAFLVEKDLMTFDEGDV